MKRFTKRTRKYLLISLLALLIVAAAGVFVWSKTSKKTDTSTRNNPTPSQSGGNENTATQDTSSGTTAPTATTQATVTKPSAPTLNKSSGNHGSVPVGAVIAFVCNGTAGNQCDVILTSKTDSSKVIKLGAKTVATNHDQPAFAEWEWTATAGNWSVVARQSNSAGSTDSPAQELTVQ